MFIPVGDDNKRKTIPVFNLLLVVANIAVYIYAVNSSNAEAIVTNYALHPAAWTPQSLLTSMFLHASLAHLVGNMLFLLIAGDNVEDRMGHIPYLIFYLAAGAAGSALHILMNPGSQVPTIGASGAISGAMGAFLAFFPSSRIKMLILPFGVVVPVRSWYAIGLWAGMQALLAYTVMKGGQSDVAVFAHIGGFVFGFLVALLLRMFGDVKKK